MSAINSAADLGVRLADSEDAEAIGRLLHDFNVEFDEPTPSPPRLARRIRELLDEGQTLVGFSNREGKADGPINYFYEREL